MEAQFGALAFAIFVAAQLVAVIAAHGVRPGDPSALASLPGSVVHPGQSPRAGRTWRADVAPRLA